jgi:Family of unknown function (DUF6364)
VPCKKAGTMTTKLTLSINEKTVQRAKRISRILGKSISKMVEEYLDSISEKEEQKEPVIAKKKDILKGKITNPQVDWKTVNAQHLKKKYGI